MSEDWTRHLWVPSTQMGQAQGRQTMVVAGVGCYVTTADGSRLFDATAALWYANLGHGNVELADAASRQARELETYQLWGGFVHPRAVELAEVLCGPIAPIPHAKVLLGSGGSDAGELAFKLARLHWQLRGETEKKFILSRDHAYHGLHGYGSSLLGNDAQRALYGGAALVPETAVISAVDLAAVRARVEEIGPGRIAAIVAEPVIGSGGVIPPPAGYLQGLRDLCDEKDILLVFDEVITGFGRAGEWFASARYGVLPDMTMFAKGITCGYAPLGGIYVAEKIWQPFWGQEDRYRFGFGVTYSGHATACAVGLKVIEILERDQLLPRVRELEALLRRLLHEQLTGLPGVAEIRCEALMAAVELDGSVNAVLLAETLRRVGKVLVRPLGSHAIVFSPPFIATDEEVERLVAAIRVGVLQTLAVGAT